MSHIYHTIPEGSALSHDNFAVRAFTGILLSTLTAAGSLLKAGNLWALVNPETLQAALTSAGLVVMFSVSTFYSFAIAYFWLQVQQAKTAKQLAAIAADRAADRVAAQVTDQVATAIRLGSDDEMPAFTPAKDATKSYVPPRKGSNMRDEQSGVK